MRRQNSFTEDNSRSRRFNIRDLIAREKAITVPDGHTNGVSHDDHEELPKDPLDFLGAEVIRPGSKREAYSRPRRFVDRPPTSLRRAIESVLENPPPSWERVFESASKSIIRAVTAIEDDQANLIRQGLDPQIAPMTHEIFRAFELTRLDEVRVVIIGQDPYPQLLRNDMPRAMGLAFSVRPGDGVPASLRNIYKAISRDFPGIFVVPDHNGDLTPWAKQGVLLLNASLTVRPGKSNSYENIWMGFITQAVEMMLETTKPIFVLWGRDAQNLFQMVEGRTYVLKAPHPQARGKSGEEFTNCGHFLAINEKLVENDQMPIDWQI